MSLFPNLQLNRTRFASGAKSLRLCERRISIWREVPRPHGRAFHDASIRKAAGTHAVFTHTQNILFVSFQIYNCLQGLQALQSLQALRRSFRVVWAAQLHITQDAQTLWWGFSRLRIINSDIQWPIGSCGSGVLVCICIYIYIFTYIVYLYIYIHIFRYD